jgi:hypothetical protein
MVVIGANQTSMNQILATNNDINLIKTKESE